MKISQRLKVINLPNPKDLISFSHRRDPQRTPEHPFLKRKRFKGLEIPIVMGALESGPSFLSSISHRLHPRSKAVSRGIMHD